MNDHRLSLSSKELQTLDEHVIPTARRWLRQYPNLADHAVKTLLHWREELIDDHGNRFVPEEERRRLTLEADRRRHQQYRSAAE